MEENKNINRIRERVEIWRKGGYVGITKTTSRLLEYWEREDRERRLFFCQIEDLETAICITEVAPKYGEAWMENLLREKIYSQSPALPDCIQNGNRFRENCCHGDVDCMAGIE